MNLQVEDEDSLTERFNGAGEVGLDRHCGDPCAENFQFYRF